MPCRHLLASPIRSPRSRRRTGHRSALAAVAAVALAATASAQFRERTCVLHTFLGEGSGDTFGWVSAPLADLDGDGALEVVVTAPFHNRATGRAYVYSGRTGLEMFRADGPSAGAQLGFSARDAGDVDGDGTHDLVVGAVGASGVAGRALVLSGTDGSVIHAIRLGAATDRFGYSVAGAGDVDRDGTVDLAIGAPLHDANGADSGRVWIVSGADGVTVLWTRDGASTGDNLGSALANVGDLNGDGRDEVAAGAMHAGARAEGRAYAYDLSARVELFAMLPDATAVDFGRFFVGTPGDVNGDRTPDVYVADFADTTRGRGTGKAYVFDGTSGARIWALSGSAAGEGFGIGRGVGDVDGDGAGDLILCGWQDSTGAPGAGRAAIVSGRTTAVLRTYTSTTAGENLGYDAHGVGDVDGDGRLDYFVTAASWSGSRGRAFLISGCDGESDTSGTGVAGSGAFVPDLALRGCAMRGRTPSLEVRDGLGAATGVLAVGTTPTAIPLGAGTLLVDPLVTFVHVLGGPGRAAGAGTGSFPVPVPDQVGLVGATVYFQSVYLDAGAPSGLSMTSRLRVVIG